MSLRGRISAASAHPQSARASAHLERYRSQDQLCMDVLVCVGSSGLSPVWVSTADQTGRYHPCRPVNKHGSSEEYCTLIHGIVRQAAPAAALDCGLTAPYSLAHMFLEFCEQSLFDAQIPVFFPCARQCNHIPNCFAPRYCIPAAPAASKAATWYKWL